jgi:hypothetical protein
MIKKMYKEGLKSTETESFTKKNKNKESQRMRD